jgi:hypothetical protein
MILEGREIRDGVRLDIAHGARRGMRAESRWRVLRQRHTVDGRVLIEITKRIDRRHGNACLRG